MKPALIIVLVIALVAGGIAALLAGRSEPPPPPPAPVAQLETTDVLIANSDIGLGSAVAEKDLRWQTWPTAPARQNFIRRSERPEAIHEPVGAIGRSPVSADEPIRESKLSPVDSEKDKPESNDDTGRRSNVNVVRFGVTSSTALK
jgi:pilus assembly protein CpaB